MKGSKFSLAVLTGGYSSEAPVSRRSAGMVMDNIDRSKWAPVLVNIDREGWWADINGEPVALDRNDFSAGGLRFDGALIMVHGTPGEDGRLQAYLDEVGIPHTNGSPRNMALTFHKGWTTALLRTHGIAVADSVMLLPGETPDVASIEAAVGGYPCFVKPNEAGSSFGVSRVAAANELLPAIEAARAEGGSVLVEQFLPGREFSIGVIPDSTGLPMALPVTEIVAHGAFFDYQAKYEGASDEITPAAIPAAAASAMQDLAVRTYRATECRGLARVDVKWDESSNRPPAVIEINTIPGFTAQSLIPQQAAHLGIGKTELIERILAVLV